MRNAVFMVRHGDSCHDNHHKATRRPGSFFPLTFSRIFFKAVHSFKPENFKSRIKRKSKVVLKNTVSLKSLTKQRI
jgi:hypothetical protein